MRSVLRSVRKRKKSRRLGEVDIISREEYTGFDVDAKVGDDSGLGAAGPDARPGAAR